MFLTFTLYLEVSKLNEDDDDDDVLCLRQHLRS